jgi:hypothetical protein
MSFRQAGASHHGYHTMLFREKTGASPGTRSFLCAKISVGQKKLSSNWGLLHSKPNRQISARFVR